MPEVSPFGAKVHPTMWRKAGGSALAIASVWAIGCGDGAPATEARRTGDDPPAADAGPWPREVATPRPGSEDAGAGSDGGGVPRRGDGGGFDAGAPCVTCLEQPVSWRFDGGLVAYHIESEISACRTYRHTQRPAADGGPAQECVQDLRECSSGDQLGAYGVAAAIAQPGVEEALSRAPLIYGRDLRAVDGALFVVTVGEREIALGAACAGASRCTDPPADVRALADTLQALDEQQLGRGACGAVF